MLSLALLALAGASSAEWASNNATASLLETASGPDNPGMKIRYIVLANPHSGAKELYDFLQEHNQIRGYKNLFTFQDTNQTFDFFESRMKSFFDCSCPYIMDPIAKTCLPYANWHDCQNKVGFLWYGGQGLANHAGEVQDFLHNNYVRVITLTRENCLSKLVEIEMQKTAGRPVTLNKNQATYFCKHDIMDNNELMEIASKAHHHLELTFEDLAYENLRSRALESIQDFMGVNRKPMVSAIQSERLGSYNMLPIEHAIANWAEFSGSLQGTDMEKFLGGKIPKYEATA